jgi:sugar lactone lactonase YvrE
VQIDSRGNVLSLDERTRRIVRVSEHGKFAGFISPKGAPAGQGYFPVSFKLDAADALYILDASSGRIVVLDASGAFLRELQQPAGARFTDLAVDGKGAVYAVDALRGQLWKAPPGATVLDKLGAPLKDYMSFAGSLVVLDSGALLVVDSHGMGLVVAAPDGAFLGRQLGIGWTDGLVYYPGQVCAVGNELLVADSGNNRVQAFTSSR